MGHRDYRHRESKKPKKDAKKVSAATILPPSTIVEVAENEGVDLIVIGSRGTGGIKRWILGSTSCRVAENCTKPVLIVK